MSNFQKPGTRGEDDDEDEEEFKGMRRKEEEEDLGLNECGALRRAIRRNISQPAADHGFFFLMIKNRKCAAGGRGAERNALLMFEVGG